MNIVLVHPQIPQNTGNIARLCAGTDTTLHLIRPLGFSLEDKYVRRAGLDYWPHVKLQVHESLEEALRGVDPENVAFYSARATRSYLSFSPPGEPYFVFGREADGLPPEVLSAEETRTFRVPTNDKIRSLNLANTCAVVLFEALRSAGVEPT